MTRLLLTEGGQGGLAIYQLAARHQLTPGTSNLGTVRAVSAELAGQSGCLKQSWNYVACSNGRRPGIRGDANGRFRAFDHESGEVLWEINLGSSVSGYPISFSVDGKQYVAVNTGGGQPNLTPELRPSRGTNLYVFALPD